MRIDDSAIQRVAVMARDAVEEPKRWNEVVRVICEYMGASGAALITRSIHPDWRALSAAWGNAADGLQPYLSEWAVHDPWEAAVSRKGIFRTAGEVRSGNEFLPRSALKRTAFYCDFASRFDLEELIALKIFDDDDQTAPPAARISIFRPPHSGEFDNVHRKFLSALHPHLDRALRAQWAIGPASAAALAAGNLLDHLPNPIWVLGRRAEVIVANAAARRLQGGDGPVRIHLGALVAVGHLGSSEIVALLGTSAGAAVALLFGAGAEARQAVVRVVPLQYESACRAAWPRGHALLTIDLGAQQQAQLSLHDFAMSTWGLTAAEARVATRLAEGIALAKIAHELSVSYSTVRSQLQAIFVKTETRRQGELISLLLRARSVS